MSKYIDAEKLIAEIESMLSACTKQTHTGVFNTCTHIKGLITSLQEEMELPEKYQTPDWIWEEQEQSEVDLEKAAEKYSENVLAGGEDMFDAIADGFKAGANWQKEQMIKKAVDLEKAAGYVYESWMGGTMNDVRRDMVELGKVLNAREK